MGYWEELRSAPSETAAPPDAKPAVDYYRELTGQEVRATPTPTRAPDITRPSVADDPNRSAGFLQTMRSYLAPDTQDQIKRFAAARFPDMPVEEAAKRYGVVDGEIVYWDEKAQQYAREVPSLEGAGGPVDFFRRLGGQVAAGVGPSAPQVAATAAGVAAGPTMGSIPAAAGAAAITDIARQILDRALAGEDVSNIDFANVLGHAGVAAAGQGMGVGINRALSRNPMAVDAYDRASALDPRRQQLASEIEAEARRRGIDLSAGQSTGLRSLLARERQLARFPETADMMSDFATRQRTEQVPGAIRAELSAIAPAKGREAAVQSFRGAADDVVNSYMADRKAAAKPLYDAAFKANQSVESAKINRILETPAGRRATNKAVELMQNDMALVSAPDAELTAAAREAAELGKMESVGQVGRGLKLRTLHYVRMGLWDQYETAVAAGQKSQASAIKNLWKGLTKEIDRLDATAKAGPVARKAAGGSYQQARQAFAQGSEAVDMILDGGVGFIKRMSGPDRVNMVSRVFEGKNLLPEELMRMRNQFAKAGKADAWNDGARTWLEGKLDDALALNTRGESNNVPGRFVKSVWGDDMSRDTLRAVLDPERFASFEKLMTVLRAASRSLPEGSPTATDLAAMSAPSVGRVARVAGKALSPQTYLNVGTELVEGISALREPRARIQLAETLLSGEAAKKLAQLRLVSPTSQRAITLATDLLALAGLSQSGVRTPRDFPAPAALAATPQNPPLP